MSCWYMGPSGKPWIWGCGHVTFNNNPPTFLCSNPSNFVEFPMVELCWITFTIHLTWVKIHNLPRCFSQFGMDQQLKIAVEKKLPSSGLPAMGSQWVSPWVLTHFAMSFPSAEVFSAKAYFDPPRRPPLLQRALFPSDAADGDGEDGGWMGL